MLAKGYCKLAFVGRSESLEGWEHWVEWEKTAVADGPPEAMEGHVMRPTRADREAETAVESIPQLLPSTQRGFQKRCAIDYVLCQWVGLS